MHQLHQLHQLHQDNHVNQGQQDRSSQVGEWNQSNLDQHQNRVMQNEVDSWIDMLDVNRQDPALNLATNGITADVTMAWLVQQSLPRTELPSFNGSPTIWVDFITKFRDLVHNQEYLNDTQRSLRLMQQLKGEPKRAVKEFANDSRGYVLALKRLKRLFGQKSKIAQATLMKVTHGKKIQNDDHESLVELYYAISDCIFTLEKLNYASDLFSTATLREAVDRLPPRLLNSWAEHSMGIRCRGEEPNLVHLDKWLDARIMAQREAYLPKKHYSKKQENRTEHVGTITEHNRNCSFCDGQHLFWKCSMYKVMPSSKKFETIKNRKLCYNCFREGHTTSKCKSKNNCFVTSCSERHHTTLHDFFTDKKGKGNLKDENKDNDIRKDFNGFMQTSKKAVYLQIVPMMLHSKRKSCHTYALLDSGSQCTLLRDDLAETLQVEGYRSVIHMATIKDKAESLAIKDVSLKISSKEGKNQLSIDSAYVVPAEKFNMPSRPRIPRQHDALFSKILEGIELDAVSAADIGILAGANVPEALIMTEVRRGSVDQPLAVNTRFGWTLFGASSNSSTDVKIHCSMIESTTEDMHVNNVDTSKEVRDAALQQNLEKFWKQESHAVIPFKETAMSREDEKALKKLEGITRYHQGRYEVPMLWNESTAQLPNNLIVAQRRFSQLKRRLKSDPELYRKYKAVIDGYVEEGHARKMTLEEVRRNSQRTWYLPTHPVMNPNKPDKIRVVNDAAAEFKGTSLNKALITGPDLLNSLVGIIVRFRTRRIAIAAVVEAMFHQVKIPADDADSLRFLWTDDINSKDVPDTYQMCVHIFGAKDSPTCANYALKRTARDNFSDFDGMTYESVLKDFYVDDLLKSVDDNASAIQLAKELIELLQRGGFRLTKFLSNSKVVTDALPQSEVSPSLTFDIGSEKLERALGIYWDTANDVFTFSPTLKDGPMTKRGMLSVVSGLFDPAGFINPYVLKAKILLQELWKLNCDWDEEVDDPVKRYWRKWLEGMKELPQLKLARCYNLDKRPVTEIQLHIFCDASEMAYGAAAYLRYSFKDGTHACSLVMAKSRLAPIKILSLPRLELNAAVTGVRLFRLLIYEIDLPIERIFFWTDSMLTLQYITNKKHRFKVYVANRVAEILEASRPDQWYHVPGKKNPADLLTRGVFNPMDLTLADKNGTTWFIGSTFLMNGEDNWPRTRTGEMMEDHMEVKRASVLLTQETIPEAVIHVTRFSNWTKLKRVAAWVLRFIHNYCKRKYAGEHVLNGQLSLEEVDAAENMLLQKVQGSAFHKEILQIKEDQPMHKTSKLMSLSPFVDKDGLLRVGGRLKHAPIPHDAKFQIVLPKDHHVTKLIINQEHKNNGHIGAEHIMANLRRKFWILNGRIAIKLVIKTCFFCRVRRAQKLCPYMADLPPGRSALEEPPFTHCGVDLFGPILIKQCRKKIKRWITLFTCLKVRCVHLEVVESQETDSFINTLRRFVNRRGCPQVMYSDCGTNFTGAVNELNEFSRKLDQEAINNFSTNNHIVWKFNPPSAPHMGGVWKRMVRSAKEILHGLVKDHTLTDPQLLTLLTEVENIINSRPLTRASEDVNDLEALTPNHLLLWKHRNWSYVADTDEKDICSRKHYRQVQGLSSSFWKRFMAEYLPSLTTRNRWREKVPNFKVGELVLLRDGENRRGKWPLARVTKVLPGKDGVVRVVELRTKDGMYTRPVVKLCKLEQITEVPQGEGYVNAE